MNDSLHYRIDADKIGWIVFDAPGSRANLFDADTQAAFASAIAKLAEQRLKALVLTSAKDRIFVAGADLKWLGNLADASAAADFSRAGQAVFQCVEDFPAPVVCAIHGACVGGGYELALASHWRIASDSPQTRIGLPEIGLGIIPGWGGCVRLPRLIGARQALDHIIKAQLVHAVGAMDAGLVNEVTPTQELKPRARLAALRLAQEGKPLQSNSAVPRKFFFDELRRRVDAEGGDLRSTLAQAIDVVQNVSGMSLRDAMEAEAVAFGELAVGKACKTRIRAFFLGQNERKRSV